MDRPASRVERDIVEPAAQVGDDQEELVSRALAFLRRRWMVMAPAALVVFVIAYASAALDPPLYTSTTTIAINPGREQVIASEQMVTQSTGDLPQLESEIQILRSPATMRRVVDTLKLEESPEFNGAAPGRVRAWFASSLGRPEATRPANLTDTQREEMRDAIARRLVYAASVMRRGESRIVAIAVDARSPRTAQLLADTLVRVYLEAQAENQFAATERANEWLLRRVQELSNEVQEKERAAEAFRRTAGLAQVASAGDGPIAPDVQTMLVAARADLSEKEARLRQVESLLRQGGSADLIAGAANSPLIVELRSREAELVRNQAEIEQRYGPLHPAVAAGRADVEAMGERIETEIARITTSLRNEVEVARNRLASLQGNFGAMPGTLSGNNDAIVQYRQLLREADAARSVHGTYLQRFQEVESQRSLSVSPASVVSTANLPSAPSSPDLSRAFQQALLLALIAGIALGALVEFLDRTISTAEEVERKVGAVAIASIPRLQRRELRPLPRDQRHPAGYLVKKPMSGFAEAFRVMRTSVLHGRIDRRLQVLAITSALPEEGKTTVSLCLARIAALSGQRAIVVDCDLRRRSLGEVLALKPDKGLLDVLTGQCDWSAALIQDRETNAQFLVGTPAPFTPVDVFSSRAMEQLLEDLRRSYDLVILDCAPVLAVADTRTAASHADAVMLVVRSGKTPTSAAKTAIRELNKAGVAVHGVAVNQITPAQRSGADSLYYGYAKKSYYTN